ncbi:MAG: VOC family protein [Sphaerobacteraceae bacterium]|nr:MAG: VOC family protein [Sphaerobacteraceae bacterium]
MLSIDVTSVLVDDQQEAVDFYTKVLGFQVKTDVPAGDNRWLSLVSPADPDGIELLLEPDDNPNVLIDDEPAAQVYKQALYDAGVPVTSFASDDLEADFERMSNLGVVFVLEPTEMDDVTVAVFDDTCGNLIQLHEVHLED